MPNCTRNGVHRNDAVAPFPLETQADVVRHAAQVRLMVELRLMPPWKPVRGFGHFRNEMLLSEREIDLISRWVDDGMPPGDPLDEFSWRSRHNTRINPATTNTWRRTTKHQHRMPTHNQNRAAWNRLADTGSQFAHVATDEELREPLKTLDGRGWLPSSVRGLNVLCLAGGGGWQSILYAVAGANTTVLDLSPSMLRLDRREAERRGVPVRIIEGSMDDLSMLDDASFDIVHQPVSTCYISDIGRVYREIARVTKDGGLYISQHKQPTSLQIVRRDQQEHYVIGIEYYHEGALPATADVSYRETGAVEYIHRWDQLVGELCRSGFVLEDLREPYRGDPEAKPGHFRHRGRYVAPYVRMKVRRLPRGDQQATPPGSQIWTP